MRGWKRRTRALKRIQRAFNKSTYLRVMYLDDGVPLFKAWRNHIKNENRKSKLFARIIRNVVSEKGDKTHYEDCAYHPCIITLFDTDNDDIKGVSLIDGTSPRSCSLLNCGVVFFSEEEATKRAAYILEHGFEKYHDVYNSFGG